MEEIVDPGKWLDAIDRGVDALPYGEAILVAAAIVGVLRWGLPPVADGISKLLRAWRCK